ncbi:MAG: succinate dehydrogenase, cytochrome b556 subunit [Pseudomonadota bacterium]|nr:succinate dehydrogenase, cytochrome b556 subunit [Pseudomonadota bacterium]
MVKSRPVYLNLIAIRQPLPAIVSILHRISGAFLFLLGIPAILTVLEASSRSPESFAAMRSWFASPVSKLVLLALVWAYLHHFFAGLRYLLIDVHVGDDLAPARRSSAIVLVVSVALTLVIAARLW